VGNAQVDTAQKKFGTASALFDGTGDYLSVPDHADWFMDTGKFTVDCLVRFNNTGSAANFFSQYEDADNRIVFMWNTATILCEIKSGGAKTVQDLAASWSPSTNTWYHIALIRGWGGNANDWAITIDGLVGDTLTDDSPWPNYAADLHIGYNPGLGQYHNGWIDEFRISNKARWTTNFTPPTIPYR
jgi:hypothetical protein